jgi:hypothetical protein
MGGIFFISYNDEVVAEEINQILQFLLKETNSNELQDNE